jgi:hypothetical protein
MKKLLVILISLIIAQITYTQKDVSYFFNNDDIEYGFFLGPELKVAPMIEGYQLYSGIKGAMIFNNTFALGLAGGGFITEIVFEGLNDLGEEALLNTVIAYGGFYLDYIVPSRLPVQVSFPNLLGVAGVTLFSSVHGSPTGQDEEMVEGGVFFIYEPALNLEFNLTNFLRIGFGGGYRLAVKGDMDRLSASDMSDVTFNFSIKFGSF